jgi:ATP phosphoribosyltransferase
MKTKPETKLRIAIQKSGRLFDESIKLLKDCGISIDNGKDQLKAEARNFPAEILYLRNSDIPQYVADGVADIAIIGENTLIEKEQEVIQLKKLGFSKCRLSIAGPKNLKIKTLKDLEGFKIATSYPNTLSQYLDGEGVRADIHSISGSVEIAPNIGLADLICDLVSSGSTLFKNGLEEKFVLFNSEACLIQNQEISSKKKKLVDQLEFRIQAVMNAKNYRYILMNVPNEKIEKINQILPVMKAPTVLPLTIEGWSSLHSVIDQNQFWEIIDQLKEEGAEDILILPIEKMLR